MRANPRAGPLAEASTSMFTIAPGAEPQATESASRRTRGLRAAKAMRPANPSRHGSHDLPCTPGRPRTATALPARSLPRRLRPALSVAQKRSCRKHLRRHRVAQPAVRVAGPRHPLSLPANNLLRRRVETAAGPALRRNWHPTRNHLRGQSQPSLRNCRASRSAASTGPRCSSASTTSTRSPARVGVACISSRSSSSARSRRAYPKPGPALGTATHCPCALPGPSRSHSVRGLSSETAPDATERDGAKWDTLDYLSRRPLGWIA